MTDAAARTQLVKSTALDLGFNFVGIARAERLDDEARRLEAWLNAGHHGQMHYLENHFDKRVDPSLLVPGARSVVSLLYNYYPESEQHDPQAPRISRYAYGEDYHFVIKRKLKELLYRLEEQIGSIAGRVFVDSAPVLERDWAKRAGLGWVGKHTLLIHPRAGSWFFLAELISDLELVPDGPIKDYCGTCRRCIDACPTDAIAPQGYLLDASRCISYLTIELRDALPNDLSDQLENWAFGCDICQEVCPWNRFAQSHNEPAFGPDAEIMDLSKAEWHDMTEAVFARVFRRSAVKRTGYAGLQRNLRALRQAESKEANTDDV